MNRRLLVGMLLAISPSLAGCTPDGPREFYRGALQARSEFVDSLSRVVDDKTAKDKFAKSEKAFRERTIEIKEGLDKIKFDRSFQRLNSENFKMKNLEPEDRLTMIAGVKAYADYCRNIGFTNVRFKREQDRLRMLKNMHVLTKAQEQLANNQPVTATFSSEAPNLEIMFDALSKLSDVNLRYIPPGMTKKGLQNLESDIPDADLDLVLTFEPQNLDVKMKGLEPPTLPAYPAWAHETNRRAKLGFNLDVAAAKK